MFERLFSGSATTLEKPWFPHMASMEIEEKEKECEVRIELPGFQPEEIDVEVTEDYLIVRARHEEPAPVGTQEGRVDELARRVDLPHGIDVEKVSALYRHGVLQVTLPRRESAPVRKVEVKL